MRYFSRYILEACVLMLFLPIIFSCHESRKKDDMAKMVKEWQNKEIIFPKKIDFTLYGKDSIDYQIKKSTYKIIMYVDSGGCTSCKLALPEWREFISQVDSLTNKSVPILFFFNPKYKDQSELSYLLQRDSIDIPVCIDFNDSVDILNHFPKHQQLQTFLLDDSNKVILIGNPIHNIRMKELYLLKISNGSYQERAPQVLFNTIVDVEKTEFDLGSMKKGESKTIVVHIKNIGKSPYVLYRTQVSCGCINVDYKREPTKPNNYTKINITYNADSEGDFNKNVMVYSNTKGMPIKINLRGRVK